MSIYGRALIEVMVAGFAAGVIGVHVVLRRLQFFTVALAHATFPGVVVAYWLGILPLLGALGFGWLVVGLLVVLTRLKQVDGSSLVGVLLAGSFGLGVLLQGLQPRPSLDLTSILTGHVVATSTADVLTSIVVAITVLAVLAAVHKELVFGAFDPLAAEAQGYPRWLDLLLLLAVEAVIITTVPAMGTILSVALMIVPAITARLWTDRLGVTFLIAGLLGAGSGLLGLTLSDRYHLAAGGAVALTTGAVFVLSWLIAPFGLRRQRPHHVPHALAEPRS
jgi:ABC-type Mn2+/Zn2+ transport system permease subunit